MDFILLFTAKIVLVKPESPDRKVDRSDFVVFDVFSLTKILLDIVCMLLFMVFTSELRVFRPDLTPDSSLVISKTDVFSVYTLVDRPATSVLKVLATKSSELKSFLISSLDCL